MSELEYGVCNSGLILNYLLQKKSDFTLYLDDGTKLSGTLLGWDADFLLLKEGKSLQMVRLSKITRLQTELEQLTALNNQFRPAISSPDIIETTKFNPSQSNVLSNYKPTLTEVKTPSVNSEKNPEEKSDSKNKLDQLVKNW